MPINSDGTLNFEYMEKYIRVMEKMAIADVMKYKDTTIEKKTKEVIGSPHV